ncbi:MAG: hypothetical protein ACXWUG_19400 [Polyangiales bacterium]
MFLAAARLALESGAFEDARRWATEAHAMDPELPQGLAMVARLALLEHTLVMMRGNRFSSSK